MSEEQAPYVVGVDPNEYAKVELMGHRVRVGQVAEVERFGVKLLRITFLENDAQTVGVEEYGGASIFCVTPITREEVAAHEAKLCRWRADELNYRQSRLLCHDQDEIDDLDGGRDTIDCFAEVL